MNFYFSLVFGIKASRETRLKLVINKDFFSFLKGFNHNFKGLRFMAWIRVRVVSTPAPASDLNHQSKHPEWNMLEIKLTVHLQLNQEDLSSRVVFWCFLLLLPFEGKGYWYWQNWPKFWIESSQIGPFLAIEAFNKLGREGWDIICIASA